MGRSIIDRAARMSLVALALIVAAAPAPAQAQDDCHDRSSPSYASYGCKVTRLRETPFVVVALQDTGINPYHLDFRLPRDSDMQGVPPWEYIDGYPKNAQALDVSLDAPDYDTAVQQDGAVWSGVKPRQLYYLPGTRIIGAYDTGTDPRYTGILDKAGHGTATASEIAGLIHGLDRNANVLIVMVQGLGDQDCAGVVVTVCYPGGNSGLQWAAGQPWIDVVSASWGNVADTYSPSGENAITKAATNSGKVVVWAGGNGVSSTGLVCDRAVSTTSQMSGPSWVVSVGAVSPESGQDYCWHSVPVDVSSYGAHWPAADYQSMDGEVDFGGTSCATPLVAGVIANEILRAREALDDPVEGPHAGGALAVEGPGAQAPETGPLADGVLTRAEARDVVLRTAFPEDFDPSTCESDVSDCLATLPTTPLYYVFEGYGLVNAASEDRATQVLLGRQPMPDRSDVDRWMGVRKTVSDAIWNTPPIGVQFSTSTPTDLRRGQETPGASRTESASKRRTTDDQPRGKGA